MMAPSAAIGSALVDPRDHTEASEHCVTQRLCTRSSEPTDRVSSRVVQYSIDEQVPEVRFECSGRFSA